MLTDAPDEDESLSGAYRLQLERLASLLLLARPAISGRDMARELARYARSDTYADELDAFMYARRNGMEPLRVSALGGGCHARARGRSGARPSAASPLGFVAAAGVVLE